MRKGWKFLFVICLPFLLTGCKKQQIPTPAVVTRIEIHCSRDGMELDKCYTDPVQMEAVLDCLRLQKSKGTAQVDPERVVGDVFEIRVGMSNGSEHIYRHRGGCYLSKDSHPWQLVDPEQGKALYTLLWDTL